MSTPTRDRLRLQLRDWNTHHPELAVDVDAFTAAFTTVEPMRVRDGLDRWAQVHDRPPTIADVRGELRALSNNAAAGAGLENARRVLAGCRGGLVAYLESKDDSARSGRGGGTQK